MRRGGRATTLVVVLAALGTAACGRPGAPTGLTAPPPGKSEAAAALLAAQPIAAPCTPAPIEERAGRVLVVGLPRVKAATDPLVAEVLDVGVGGVLLTHANVESRQQAADLIAGITSQSAHGLVVATDEEPGRVTSFSVVFGTTPSARRLATTMSPEEVRTTAFAMGTGLADLGITVDLAPVADLDDGPARSLVGDRSFSIDAEVSSAYARAWADGLTAAGVTPVVKHFPGHGRSSEDTHLGAGWVGVPLADLRATDLVPFADLIGAGTPVVMVGHVTYGAIDADTPASMSAATYALLRGLGFRGVAMTDSIGMGAVNLRWDFDAAAIKAIAAGADAVLATDGHQARRMRDALIAAVASGELDEARLDEAAARMAALAGADPFAAACMGMTLPALKARAALNP